MVDAEAMALLGWQLGLDHCGGAVCSLCGREAAGQICDRNYSACMSWFSQDYQFNKDLQTKLATPYTKVTWFQLEKIYGKSKEAKDFLKEVTQGGHAFFDR